MRRELRESVGAAIKLAKGKWDDLDCIESDDIFLVLKPGGQVTRQHFTEPELRPLLRQAVVAISAAVESYIVAKAGSFVSTALDNPPPRLKDVSVSLVEIMEIEEKYSRRRWGHRAILERHIETEASPDPSKVGRVMSTVGVSGFWPKVDAYRKVAKGKSEAQLSELYRRRNKIAHTGDRTPTGRSSLKLEEVEGYYSNAKSIVEALEAVL